jgi:hypothetical protein
MAGIGVGVAAGVSMIAALAFVFGRRRTREFSSQQNEVRRTFTGGFVPRGSLAEKPEKGSGSGFITDSSDKSSVCISPHGRPNYEVVSDEPTVGEMRVPVSDLPASMTVRRPENGFKRAELPGSNVVHELP